MYYLPDLIDIQ